MITLFQLIEMSSSVPPHRKTIRHFNDLGHAHALTFSCYRKQKLLASDNLCLEFTLHLLSVRKKLDYHLWAYVLMPNHVHLLVKPMSGEYSIAQFLQMLKGPFGYRAKRNLHEQGVSVPRFWQAGPGFDENVADNKRALELMTYFHNNPVRRGLVSDPVAWRWSSAQFWAGREDVDLAMDIIE